MKNMVRITRLLVAIGLVFAFNQCDKTPEEITLAPYAETSLDPSAGTWKTYILPGGDGIPVAAPEEVSSAAYQAELASLKSAMAATTESQREAAQFWGGNGVLRWHEIVRELAAEYNHAPKYDPVQGKYPVPDPANPTALPRFPFANPPYTARALALLGVAQYDALVTTWHYKFRYNRLAPYKNDASIQSLIPTNDLPSYPSEDAVIAAASAEVLKFLFPGEKEKIDAKAREHRDSRIWAGANVQSDLDAGTALGIEVAKRIIDYAKTDGMGGANKQSDFPLLKDDATARGFTSQWQSLEVPARPPLLPFYGNVKLWNMSLDDKTAIRPTAPPQPGSPQFEADLAEMRDISKNRTRDQYRIAAYWADGTGTYTPPGHWNRKAAELIHEAQWNEIRTARALALVGTSLQDAGVNCWYTKYYYLSKRPTDVDGDISTSTGIPNFPGYVSGHSTFSGAAATVLSYLFPAKKSELEAMAFEASESRIYGCIHFRVDCVEGLKYGEKIGGFAVERGKKDNSE